MARRKVDRVGLALGTGACALMLAASPVLGAAAMAQAVPPMNYGDGQYGGQQDAPPPGGGDYRNPVPPADQAPQGYDAPPSEPGAPEGYDPSRPPPPPQGYAAPEDMAAINAADQRYAYEAQRWAAENCVKSHGDTAAGAVVGGIFGAILGGAIGGGHGGAVAAGAALGAVGGAAVASNSGGATSPGCPPHYVLRRDAAPYGYAPSGYYYAAPSWYVPWVFVGGAWTYRPYPYHDWYWRTYRAPHGWHGGPGWRGGRAHR